MLTYGQLKDQQRLILWPSPGEPRNLRVAHDAFFLEAMIEISQWVPCLQENNTQVHPACSALLQCAKTVVPAPTGVINRIYTIADDNWCDKVWYRSRSFLEVERFSRNLMRFFTQPDQNANPPLQEGFRNFDKANNSKCGRARLGLFAIHRKMIHVAPWLESHESLVVEWDGPKSEWNDADPIDTEYWTTDVLAVVRAYVKWRHEAEFGCNEQRIKRLEKEYRDGLADTMYWCDRMTEQLVPEEVDIIERFPTKEERDADKVPDEEVEEVFWANIGDLGGVDGSVNANTQAVADLIDSKNPEFIVTNGDTSYGTDYDLSVGRYYSKWIVPYDGQFEKGESSDNRFWPALGNHDWDAIDAYKEFFALPNNERYYELVRGPVHFFILDGEPDEPDGNSVTSKQAMWLKARMKVSPARWKIVVTHDAPYTNANPDSPGHTIARWPYKDWGADLVLSGDSHGIQFIIKDGLNYVVNGAGGRPLVSFVAPQDGTLFADNEHFGAGFVRVTCERLTYEFVAVGGTTLYTLTIDK